jgi:site-specific recombinase XerD|tara:strand:+ start:22 stop:828 length:807 start_codon:yes stop_codon:yes gene_type:complete
MAKQGQSPILTREQQQTVLKSFVGTKFEQRNTAIFLLGFRSGLRSKEIAQLNTNDFLSRPLTVVEKRSSKSMSAKTISAKTSGEALWNAINTSQKIDKEFKREIDTGVKFIHEIGLQDPPYTDKDIKQTVTLRSDVTKGSKIEKAIIRSTELRKALVDYFNVYQEQYFRSMEFVNWDDSSATKMPLFVTNKGMRFTPNGVSHLFMSLSKSCQVPFSSHSSRRTLCTELVQKGTNIFDVQQLMRHRDVSTTMLYYQKDESRLGEIMKDL